VKKQQDDKKPFIYFARCLYSFAVLKCEE